MKNSAADVRATNALQNKVRGLVSAYKSKKFVRKRLDDPLRDLRIGVRHQLLDARAELSPTQYGSFIQWVDTQLLNQAADYFRTSSDFDDLAGVYEAPVVSLERELLWVTARAKALKARINLFLKLKQLVEIATIAREYEEAIEVISQMEKYIGCSMWSVQTRIALEHQAGGLERQKNYVSEIRSVYRTGLLNFVAYHTSVRNEDKTTIGKFVDDINNRIDRHSRYNEAIKTYLKCILAQEWPSSEEKLTEVIRVAQSHSFVDVYESFVGVVQSLVRNEVVGGTRATMLRCIHELSDVDDARLAKVLFHLADGANWETFSLRNTTLSDSLFLKKPKPGENSFKTNELLPLNGDPWLWIYSGFEHAAGRSLSRRVLKQPADLPLLLGRVLSQRTQEEDALAQFSKLVLNFSGLRVFAGLAAFVPILRVQGFDEVLHPQFVGLNSPTLGIEDIPRNGLHWTMVESFISSVSKTPTERAWRHFLRPNIDETLPQSLAESVLCSAGLLNTKCYAKAFSILQKIMDERQASAIHSLLVSLQLRALRNFGARQKLIELVAYEGAKGLQSFSLLPIQKLFENFQWEDFKDCSVSLSTPVALHLWLVARDNDEVRSWMRFSTARFLKISNCNLPSHLIDSSNLYLRHQLRYFLENICVPSVLDVSRVLKGTRQVLEERQAICAVLRELDPKNSHKFQDEIAQIANELALQEGQSIVDKSRIHVDTSELKRWATRELAEDFDRYLDLMKVDLRATKDFDEIVQDILDGTLLRSNFIPENEADAVLYSILMRLAEEFLINPTFGFDFYLSKRVRHQSFIGLIRGPLEFSNLITTRESEGGKYRDNLYWMERFSTLGPQGTQAINEALLRFGSRFDEVLSNAKNNLFHVRSAEKPSGMFGVDVTLYHLALFRTLVHTDENVSDFIDTATAIIWAMLDISLAAVRKHISDDIQMKIAGYFDELKAGIRKIADADENLIEFNVVIGQTSADVQRALDDASRWFSRTSLEAQMRQFSLEQVVKVGIDSALKAQRAFNPNIRTNIAGEMTLRASALVFVYDVFFVAIDNVRKYSGIKQPWININVSIGSEGDELHIDVRSQTRGVNRANNEKTMADIRQVIENQSLGQRTRKEGLSGFIKIAAVTSQSSKGRIAFGYASDDEFYLHVTYSLVITAEVINEFE